MGGVCPTAQNCPMTTLPQEFQAYLSGSKSLTKQSIKNYVSDINIFLGWLASNLQEPQISPAHITSSSILSYRDELNNSRQPLAVKNRYLSSLRRFGHFLFTTKLCTTNPAVHLSNVDAAGTTTSNHQILAAFKHDLNKQNLSPSTVKNYLSDIKQYLNWANKLSK